METGSVFSEILAGIAVVFGPLATILNVMRGMGRKSQRDRLQQDIAMISQLPPDDARTKRALADVYARLEQIQNDDHAKTRDYSGMWLGAIMFLAFGGLSVFLATLGGLWWIGFVLTSAGALLGAIGFGISVPRTVRDEKGSQIRRS